MNRLNLKGVTAEVWTRTGILFLALVNQAVVTLKIKNGETDADSFAVFASYALVMIGALWSWWKNNSFTAAAIKADSYMDGLKERK